MICRFIEKYPMKMDVTSPRGGYSFRVKAVIPRIEKRSSEILICPMHREPLIPEFVGIFDARRAFQHLHLQRSAVSVRKEEIADAGTGLLPARMRKADVVTVVRCLG